MGGSTEACLSEKKVSCTQRELIKKIWTSKTKVLQLPAAEVWHGSVKTAKFWQQYEYQTQLKYANWPVARKHLVLQDMVFKDQNAQSLKFSETKICSSIM